MLRAVCAWMCCLAFGCGGAPSSNGDAGATDSAVALPAPWVVTSQPVYAGQYAAVGDPSVVRTSAGYLMFHQCLDVGRMPQGAEICLAQSSDGLAWTPSSTHEATPLVLGRLLRSTAGSWNEAHETPFARLDSAGQVSLSFIGYRGAAFGAMPPDAIGRVVSGDPLAFPAIGAPTLVTDPTGADAFGITSPSGVDLTDGTHVLYYTGWCGGSFACPHDAGSTRLTLLAATSTDESAWTRHAGAIVGDPGLAWTNGGVSETEVARGPDGRYYLFFSSLSGAAGSMYATQRIGVAVASDPFGPFTFAQEPIVAPEPLGAWASGGVLAPAVLFEGARVRLWFHGFEKNAAGDTIAARIGYAENVLPLL